VEEEQGGPPARGRPDEQPAPVHLHELAARLP
jgi:hypothetical protein